MTKRIWNLEFRIWHSCQAFRIPNSKFLISVMCPIACTTLIVFLLAQPQPALAYVKFGVRVGGRQITLKWAQTPVRYFIKDLGVPGVTTSDLQAATGRAFASWQAVPTSAIAYQFAGFTNARPGDDDGL